MRNFPTNLRIGIAADRNTIITFVKVGSEVHSPTGIIHIYFRQIEETVVIIRNIIITDQSV